MPYLQVSQFPAFRADAIGDGWRFCSATDKKRKFCLPPQRNIEEKRSKSAPSLAQSAAMPKRNLAIVRACATGCYAMKDIAQAFEIHYATVGRIEKMTDNFGK